MKSHDSLIQELRRAGGEGLTAAAFQKPTGAKAAIDELKAEGSIRGPIKIGRLGRYFLTEHAPTTDRVSGLIEKSLSRAGLKLTSLSKLEEDIGKFAPKQFFKDALSALRAEGRIVEVKDARRSKYYLHREPLLEQLRAEAQDQRSSPKPVDLVAGISLDQVRPVYQALKSEQGGINTVTISDVLKRINGTKAELHRLLLEEARRGQVTLHPATTTNFPDEVLAAGLRLEGEPHTFITFTLRDRT